MDKRLKESSQLVGWTANEIHGADIFIPLHNIEQIKGDPTPTVIPLRPLQPQLSSHYT